MGSGAAEKKILELSSKDRPDKNFCTIFLFMCLRKHQISPAWYTCETWNRDKKDLFMKIIQKKKLKQNFEYINQYHVYHIIIIYTAVNTHKMQSSKSQIFTNGNTHTMQHT